MRRNFLICTPHQILNREAEHVARYEEKEKSMQGFVGKPAV